MIKKVNKKIILYILLGIIISIFLISFIDLFLDFPIKDFQKGGIDLDLVVLEKYIDYNLKNENFDKPILFYLIHEEDKSKFFYTFVIYNISEGKLTYLISYIPENIKKVGNHPDGAIFSNLYSCSPHYAVDITPGKDFYVFTYGVCNYFYYVNYQDNIMKIITSKDLGINNLNGFGDTFYKENNTIIFTGSQKEKNEWIVKIFNATTDFNKIQKIFEMPNNIKEAPHTTKKVGNLIFNSQFVSSQFYISSINKIFSTRKELTNFIMGEIYNPLSLISKLNIIISRYLSNFNQIFNFILSYINSQLQSIINEVRFLNHFEKGLFFKNHKIKFESDFEMLFKKNYANLNFVELLSSKYSYNSLPGEIILLNTETNEQVNYKTSSSNSAHFEIFDNYVYVSSHNFGSFFGDFLFTGPAAIDKYKISDQKLIYNGTFFDEKGYRFTSHVAFSYENQSYLATFGQPNRLFIIDANNMSLLYYEDIGPDYLSEIEDVKQHLNSVGLGKYPNEILPLVVTKNGEFLVFLSSNYIFIYSIPKKSIVQKIRYIYSDKILNDINLNQFKLKTTHTQFLE
jgi:hypothetical protein